MTTLYLIVGFFFGIHSFFQSLTSHEVSDCSAISALLKSVGISACTTVGWPLYMLMKYQDSQEVLAENRGLKSLRAQEIRAKQARNKRLEDAAFDLGRKVAEAKIQQMLSARSKGGEKTSVPEKGKRWTTTLN